MANVTLPLKKSTVNWRLALLSTTVSMTLCYGVYGQSAADQEKSARQDRVMEAQTLLMQGDVAYGSGKYAEAAKLFLKAKNLLPDAAETKELRNAATERYTTASTQQASKLASKGDIAAAKQAVDNALADEIAPNDPAALAMRAKLDDPIRTNPASAKEHTRDVDEVRRSLYEAEGFVQLGRFDLAKGVYEEVLRVDSTNKAARRGLEKVAQHKTDHARAGHDQTRAEMLAEVDALWETPVLDYAPNLEVTSVVDIAANAVQFVSEKMRNVVIPDVELEDVGIEEAIDFVRNQARQLDTTTTDPVQKGFNIVLNIGTGEIGTQVRAMRFNLQVKNVPVSQLLTYICEQTRTQFSIDEYAINIRPLGTDGVELTTRTFKVPPDFLSADSVGNSANAAATDPFDDAPSEGLTATRMTAEEKLRSMGVSFPEGATASFNGGSSTLLVRNTASNMDYVQQIVDSAAQTEPVQCIVEVKIIKVQETRLKELGLDWIMTPWGVGNNTFVGGGTQGNGDLVIDDINFKPITSGLRAGDTSINKTGIDELISAGTSGFSASGKRAPGALSLLGQFSDVQVAAILNGLDQKKGVDTMTRPSTVVRSGQTSRIEVIREMIYPTEYEPPELPNTIESTTLFDGASGQVANLAPPTPITPAMPTAFEKRNVGTTLEVSPIVSTDRRYIELALKPEIVSFDGFVNYGTPIIGGYSSGTDFFDVPLGAPFTVETTVGVLTPNEILMPIFSVIRTNTSLTIADGSTVVIGGMIEEKLQNVEDQVPILGDLPFFGRMFRSQGRQPVKTNVIIMVRVELQDPSGKPYRSK